MRDLSPSPLINSTETYTIAPSVTNGIRKVNLNYATTTSSPDLEQIRVGTAGSGGTTELTAWRNESGFLRGTPHAGYKDDALVRAVPRGDLTTENGGYTELQNAARTLTVHARRWRDGALVRNGTVMNDVIVLTAAGSVPSGLPAGTVIFRTAT